MSKAQQFQLDNLLHALGDWKKFTILQFLAISVSTFPIAYQLFSNVFISHQVPYRCKKPHNESELLADYSHHHGNVTVSYQQCQIVLASGLNNTVLSRQPCLCGVHYDLPKYISAISQFDLVCEFTSLAKLSQTLVIAGQGVGAILAIVLSDRFGRKPVFILGNLGLFVMGLAVAFAPNYPTFAALKFCAGIFQQALVTNNLTMILELLTTSRRRMQAWLAGMVWAFAMMTLAPWAFLFRNLSWRMLQIALSLVTLLAFLQFRFVKESLRWLIANGKKDATLEYLKYATTMNKTSYKHALQVYEDMCSEKENCLVSNGSVNMVTSRQLSLLDLLKVKRLLINSLVMWCAWFTTTLSFFALYLTATSLAGNRFLNFFLTALMEIPANGFLFITLNRIGRKLTLMSSFLMVSVGLIVSGVFQSLEGTSCNSTLALVFSMLAMMGASACLSTAFFYTPELFPTNMRTQAVGLSSVIGRIGGMIAPFTGVLSQEAKWAPGVLIGSCACLVCILLNFLPETEGRDLPQTIEDILEWHKKKKKDKETERVKPLVKSRMLA